MSTGSLPGMADTSGRTDRGLDHPIAFRGRIRTIKQVIDHLANQSSALAQGNPTAAHLVWLG